MKLIPIKMQNIIAKKMTAFNSDALGTINDNDRSLLHQQLCQTKHEQFKFKGLISAASTTSSRIKWYFHFRFCHVFNSCLSMHQILIKKIVWFSLDFLAFMKAIITVAKKNLVLLGVWLFFHIFYYKIVIFINCG